MPGNSNLHDSSRNKQDEFYTNLQLIGNNPGFEDNVIAETVDGKRKLVRFYSGCIAYYEQNVLKALLCERVESQIEYDVLIKILKARGDLPIICSSYEY